MTDWTPQPFPFDDPTKPDLTIKTPLRDGGPRPQGEVSDISINGVPALKNISDDAASAAKLTAANSDYLPLSDQSLADDPLPTTSNVMVWNRALTYDEITKLYQQGLNQYWKLDEPSGTLKNKVWSAEELLATDFPSPSVIERLREWTANTIWRVAGWLDTLAEWVDCP